MGFYPPIDYVGGMRGIADQISAIPQDARNYERLRQQAEEAKSMQTYRALQVQKMQQDMDQENKLNTSLSNYGNQMRTNPDFSPTVGQRNVADYTTELGGDEYSVPGEKTENFAIPPKRSPGSGLGEYLMDQGLGKQGLDYILKYKDAGQKAEAEVMKVFYEKSADILKSENPQNLNHFIKLYQSNPAMASILKKNGIEDMSIDPKTKALETITETTIGPEGGTNPISGEHVDPGKYKIVTKTPAGGKPGITEFTKKSDVSEGSDFKHYVETMRAAGKSESEIDSGWDQRMKGRRAVEDADMRDIKKSVQQNQVELQGQRIEANKRKEARDIMAPIQDALAAREGMNKKPIDPARLEEYRQELGKIEKDIQEIPVPGETVEGYFGTSIGSSQKPTKYNYRIIDKKSPISGQKTSGLSGFSDAQLYASAQSRGIGLS